MTKDSIPPKSPIKLNTGKPLVSTNANNTEQQTNIGKEIVKTLDGLPGGLRTYPIRKLVEQAKDFGSYLQRHGVETNQIRKFLDAVNRLKAKLNQEKNENENFSKIEADLVLLKPKLAYAVARASKKQSQALEQLSEVISKAIDKVKTVNAVEDLTEFREDFSRLVQLIESIIAYHKAEGGK